MKITLLLALALVSMACSSVHAVPGDLNRDGVVDYDDFYILAGNFGKEGPPDAPWVGMYDTLYIEIPVSDHDSTMTTILDTRLFEVQYDTVSYDIVTMLVEVSDGAPRAGDEISVILPGGLAMEFVWIEPGTFAMGSPESEPGRNPEEGPLHEVILSRGYWLGKYEITQGQWEAVMGTKPWLGQSYVADDPSHPAVYISWDDVQDFVERFNEVTEELEYWLPSEAEWKYELPSEAQWEYACRAGTATRWSFGDDEGTLGQYAWYRANVWDAGLQHALPVGTKLANPWGLYDLHGNVYEWVQDVYGTYTGENQADPTGPSTGLFRVLRGGYFVYTAQGVRSASRHFNSPIFRGNFIGARLARTR